MKTLMVLGVGNGGGYLYIDRDRMTLYGLGFPYGVTLSQVPVDIPIGDPLVLCVSPADPSIESITIVTKPVTSVEEASFVRALEVGIFSPFYSPNSSLQRGAR